VYPASGRGSVLQVESAVLRNPQMDVERIKAWAITAKTRALPESGLVKAIDCMLGVWRGLVRQSSDVTISRPGRAIEVRGVERRIVSHPA
jgi:hypothetical protein